MNWKLIFQLSIFGLIMAFATVSLIPEKVEPAFWIVVFVFSAWVIVRAAPGKYFLHGFLVSLVNCVWIVAVHIYFFQTYMAHHPYMASMTPPAPLNAHPRLAMLVFGPIFGILCGIILGLFSFVASKIAKKG